MKTYLSNISFCLSSLKKIFAGVLVVAMLATTYSFDTLAVTLDTLVTKESTINQERNKDNQTKYFEQFLNEKNQLLMKGDEGDGSVLTTMPTDNQDDKNTDTTTQNKDVVITTMPSDDKISPDDFANEKTEDEVEAEEDDNKEDNNEAYRQRRQTKSCEKTAERSPPSAPPFCSFPPG